MQTQRTHCCEPERTHAVSGDREYDKDSVGDGDNDCTYDTKFKKVYLLGYQGIRAGMG